MGGDGTTPLQDLIDRLRAGDAAARSELIDHSYDRLRRMARARLHRDFPRLEHLHGTDSVAHGAVLRLLKALEVVHPQTPLDFLRFSAEQVRRTLLDLCRMADRKGLAAAPGGSVEEAVADRQDRAGPYHPPADTYSPAELAMWTEFHEAVARLPDDERAVVDLHWYEGLPFPEAAERLGVHENTAKKRWRRAVHRLPRCVG